MFCPQCKAEYRPGFTRCLDCDVDLIGELSESDNSAGNEQTQGKLGTVRSVWAGKDQARCVSICDGFKAAGIPFKVEQRRRQYLIGMDEHYKIGVPPEFFNKARKIIIIGRVGFTDEA